MTDEPPDPYDAYFDWCRKNGFADVADCGPEDLDVKRFEESMVAYAQDKGKEP